MIEKVETGRRLAIVGYSPTLTPVPFDDPEWDIWGMNMVHLARPGYDKVHWQAWFQMHKVDVVEFTTPDCIAYLSQLGMPVYMLDANPHSVPNSVRYPLEEVVEVFGDYYTSSIPYMLDLGYLQGYEEIRLWGINYANPQEAIEEQPCTEYHAGLIQGMGVPVTADPASRLFKHPINRRYGYETWIPSEFLSRPQCGIGGDEL